jgi:uncharacterized protein YbjT (DUF2867 family)
MILVTGGTGFIGRRLVSRLMQQGIAVRCLLPPERQTRLPWETPPPIITGTILDEEALFKAVTGVRTIIHLENALWWGNLRNLERVEVAGTRDLLTAARAARVGRIITLSQLGASPSSAYTLLRIKGNVENIVRTSGLAYTIIRSGLVFGEDDSSINALAMQLAINPLAYIMPGFGEVVLQPIYVDDLVDAIIRSLELIDTVDNTIEIGGPEYITYNDLLTTVMRVSQNYRSLIQIPPYTMRALVSIWSFIFPRALMTSQWLDLLAAHRAAKLHTTYNVFGIHPQRLEDRLLTYMKNKNYTALAWQTIFRRPPKGL